MKFRIKVVREPGLEPISGEYAERAEEVVEVEADSLWQAAYSKARLAMTLPGCGQLLRFYEADTEKEVVPPEEMRSFQRSKFSITGVQGPYEGYARGETWNGWTVPYFEFMEATRIIKDCVRVNQEMGGDMVEAKGWYSDAEDAFFLYDPIYDDEVRYDAQMIEVNGEVVKVYGIGSQEWTWEEVRN